MRGHLPLLVCALVASLVTAGSATAGTIPGQYIVVLESEADSGAIAKAHARSANADVLHVYDRALNGYAARLSAAGLRAVRSDPRVAFVSEDRVVRASAQALPTGVNRIEGDVSTTRAGDGSGSVNVAAAVIDTGIDLDHPDLNVVGGVNCSTSNRFNWTTRWTREQLLAVLSETLRAHTGGSVTSVRRVDDVAITERNRSERVTVRLTADGTSYTLRMDSVRWVLRPQPTGGILNSSKLAAIEATRGSDGAVQALEVRGGGWGHAIGMCQVGAMGRARAGQTHAQILRAYYTDVELQRLY